MAAVEVTLYESDGTTLDTSNYTLGVVTPVLGLDCVLARFGGCLGGRLRTSGDVRDSFAISQGQVVKVTLDGTLVYTGDVLAGSRKRIEGPGHQYELRGWWDRLARVSVASEVVFGADSSEHSDEDTIGEIVTWLLDNWIVPAGVGITYSAGDISSSVTVDWFRVRANEDLFGALRRLMILAESAGADMACGVAADGSFFFKPVSTGAGDLQATLTVGSDAALTGEETPAPIEPVNHVAVIGDVVPTKGLVSKKTFEDATSVSSYGRRRLRFARAEGIYQEADLTKFWQGIAHAYAQPATELVGATRLVGSGEAAPLPWAGQVKYTDLSRGDIGQVSAWALDLDLTRPAVRYRIDLGAQSDDAVDPFVSSRDLEEGLAGLPDVTDVTSGPSGEPHLSGPQIPYEGTNPPGGAGGGAFEAADCINLMYPGGAQVDSANATGDTVRVTAIVYNGGDTDALEAGDVRASYRFFQEDGTPNGSADQNLTRLSQDGDWEVWYDPTGYALPQEEGTCKVAVRVEIPDSDPATYQWYPSDISSDGDDLPIIRVIDKAGAALVTGLAVIAGWTIS